MILDPINSITSLNFYKKVSSQGLGRTFLYLGYMGLLYALVSVFWLKFHFLPLQQKTFRWLETSIPAITYANGRISTPTNEPVTIRHPEIEQLAFTIDTGRTEPVTPQMLREGKIVAYVTATAMYLMQPGGRVEVYDLSKSPATRPVVLDAKLWQELTRIVTRMEYPITFFCCFFAYFFWKMLTAAFFSLVALLINGLTEAGLDGKALFNMSAYAQSLVLALTAVILLAQGMPPMMHLLYGKLNLAAVAVTTLYLWLAIKKGAAPKQTAA